MADSTNDATAAAKKYNKQLAKFDEINNLNTQDSDSGSGSGLSNLGGGGFDVGSYFDDTNTAIDTFKFDFNSWLQEVNDWLGKYKEVIADLGVTIGEKFNDLVNYIDWDLLGNTIIKGLNELFTSINNFFNTANFVNFGSKIGDMINSGLQELDPSAWGQIMVNKLNAFFQTAYGFVTTLDWGLLGTRIQETFRAALEAIDWNSISGTFINGLNGISTVVLGWADTFPIQETMSKLWQCLSDIIQGVDWHSLGESFNKLITQMIHGLKDIDYGEVTGAISEFLDGLDIVNLMLEWFSLKVDVIVEGICGLLTTPEG